MSRSIPASFRSDHRMARPSALVAWATMTWLIAAFVGAGCRLTFPQVVGGCGDGKIDEGEGCDDGNQTAGDGCDAVCAVESGWSCQQEPSRCSPICGNGRIDEGEGCDDGNQTAGDGCDAVCAVESGWSCQQEPSRCSPNCGDGQIVGTEDCDGTNLADQTCTDLGLEGGTLACSLDCTFDTSACWYCGNGVTDPGEECDGGGQNTESCDEDCTAAVCGDGVFNPVAREECDDANEVDDDGCADCKVSDWRVNTYTQGNQNHPAVARGGDGRFVVVWQSDGQDGDGLGVFGQLYDSVGHPIGNEFQVNTFTAGDQEKPAVAMGGDGRFVVLWKSALQDGYQGGIYAQLYDANGDPLGDEFLVNSEVRSEQTNPAVVMGDDGRFIAVWQSWDQDGSWDGIFCQRYDANGGPVDDEFQVNTYTDHSQGTPVVDMGDDGRFVVVWNSDGQDGDDMGIYGQLYDGAAAPVGGEFRVNETTSAIQRNPDVAMGADGFFLVVWQSVGQDGYAAGIFARQYNASGSPQGPEFLVNSYVNGNQWDASVAMDADGQFLVVWQSDGQDGDAAGIFGQRYDGDASVVGEEFQINLVTVGYQTDPALAMADNGRFVVVWRSGSSQDGDGDGVFGALYSIDGLREAPGLW